MRLAWWFILSVLTCSISAQNAEYFHFSKPGKTQGSLFNCVEFIDSREDTSDFGTVYSLQTKRPASVSLKIDLPTQLNWLLVNMVDSTDKRDTFVFNLRKFKFSERPSGHFHTGYFVVRAEMYLKAESELFKLGEIDRFLKLPDSQDFMAQRLFTSASKTITDFISEYIKKREIHGRYTYEEIKNANALEKSKLKLYGPDQYPDLAYFSYDEFKNQQSKYRVIGAVVRYGKIKKLIVKDSSGAISRQDIVRFYAFTYKNQLYIVSEKKCYPLTKRGNDFFFNKTEDVSEVRNKYTARELFVLSYKRSNQMAVSPITNLKVFEMKLDPINGTFDVVRPLHYVPLTK